MEFGERVCLDRNPASKGLLGHFSGYVIDRSQNKLELNSVRPSLHKRLILQLHDNNKITPLTESF